jgi:hypothetical protein
MEADLAEQKAKRLREQASALAQQFGVTDTLQQQYGAFFPVMLDGSFDVRSWMLIVAIAIVSRL